MKLAITFVGIGIAALIAAVSALLPDAATDRGKEVYAMQKCALCHSVSGVGGKMLPLDGVGTRLTAENMGKWIRTPKAMKADTPMKAYPNLPEKDLADLTAYLLTLK